jgi:predicted O-methyltransferase YrrM
LSRADKVLKDIERISEKKFLPIVGPERGKILVGLIHNCKPKRILEVGTLVGYSAILMAKELSSDAHLITIGINADETERARENVTRAGLSSTIEVITGDAIDVLPTLKGTFDMVFIDADKSEYMEYLRLVEHEVRRGGVIVADNAGTLASQMKDYLHYVRSSSKYHSRYVPIGEDGLEISFKL